MRFCLTCNLQKQYITGYKLVCQFSLPAEIIFDFSRDCLWSLFYRVKTAVRDKRLPVETVCMILLPAETWQEAQSR